MVSPVALRRMIALRNWLPEDERHLLDGAIRQCRLKQVECAQWPERIVEDIIVSNIDGVGAQSVFTVSKDGRKRQLANLLVKRDVGIADAWCVRDQTKGEVKSILEKVNSETDSHNVDPEFLHILVPHYLAVGLKNDAVPIPGFLEFIESVGIEKWQPNECDNEDLATLIESSIAPSRIQPKAVTKVIKESADWIDELDFLDSWFEDNAEVDQILFDASMSDVPQKVDEIIKLVLESRRAIWAEQFLWTALWLKESQGLLSPWVEFFIIGRELNNGRPIIEIPIMRGIAETTVLAKMAPY